MKNKTKKSKQKNTNNSTTFKFTKYHYILAVLVISILATIYFTFSSPSISKLSSINASSEVIENLDLTFTEDSTYSFTLIGKPSSIKLSGTIEGDVKVYLSKNLDRYLIYENTNEIVESDTTNEDTNQTIESNITTQETNETIEEPQVVEDNNETIEETNETEEPQAVIEEPQATIEEPQIETEESQIVIEEPQTTIEEPQTETEEPQTETEEPQLIIEEPQAIQIEESQAIIFNDACIDTCSLEGFNDTIELTIEVNGILTLTRLLYTIEEEETNETINITTYDNETIIEINETNITITIETIEINGTNTTTINETLSNQTSITNSTEVDITIEKFFTYHITTLSYENGVTRIKFDVISDINETKEEVSEFIEEKNLEVSEFKTLAQKQTKQNYEMVMIGDDLGQIFNLITQIDKVLKMNIEADIK